MAHLLMLHGHPVGYLPPTYASEILTSGGDSVQTTLDNITKVITGTLASSSGWSNTIYFPTGFSINDTYVLTLLVADPNGWRIASEGLQAGASERIFPEINGSGIRVYNNISAYFGATFKMVLAKI